jgi:flagellar hook assembly protein FlgD
MPEIIPLSRNLEGKPIKFGPVYPNPYRQSSNDILTLEYTLPANGLVRIRLYNASGQLVSEPLLNRQIAGENVLFFNAKTFTGQNLPPGVYIIRLDYGNQILSQKLVISD